MEKKPITVGFIGNPNCGKTTLFNAFTGANLKVGNWPGVTVEKKEGKTTYQGQEFRLIDLPGTYSLTSYTMEETVPLPHPAAYRTGQTGGAGSQYDGYRRGAGHGDRPAQAAGDAGRPGHPGIRPEEDRPLHPNARGGPSLRVSEPGTLHPSP